MPRFSIPTNPGVVSACPTSILAPACFSPASEANSFLTPENFSKGHGSKVCPSICHLFTHMEFFDFFYSLAVSSHHIILPLPLISHE